MIFNFRRVRPNPIDSIEAPMFSGKIGMVACPGIRIGGNNQKVEKNFKADIEEIVEWGAGGLISLVEEHEFTMAGVESLPESLEAENIWWRHMPMMDMYIPEQDFEQKWIKEGKRIRALLRRGEHVLIHCYAGLGRTGLVAAKILVDFGMNQEDAILEVRKANKRRIQTKEQAEYIRSLKPRKTR